MTVPSGVGGRWCLECRRRVPTPLSSVWELGSRTAKALGVCVAERGGTIRDIVNNRVKFFSDGAPLSADGWLTPFVTNSSAGVSARSGFRELNETVDSVGSCRRFMTPSGGVGVRSGFAVGDSVGEADIC